MSRPTRQAIPLSGNKTPDESDHDTPDEVTSGESTRFNREQFQSLPQARPAHLKGHTSLLQIVARPLLQSSLRRYLYAAALIVLVVLAWTAFPRGPLPPPPPPLDGLHRPPLALPNSTLTYPHIPVDRPQNTRIVGLVFYGRRSRASILDCYLRRNLASNGGWLDEVAWGVNTDYAEDLAYLEQLIARTPDYRKIEIKNKSYYDLWKTSLRKGVIYIKVDDDVVYIKDDAIPLMVDALLRRPEAMMISANPVNNAKLSWVQYRVGAIVPYLPELAKATDKLSSKENPVWRPSELPMWTEPKKYKLPDKIEDFYSYFRGMMYKGPLEKEGSDYLPLHRWLPVNNKDGVAISKTPIIKTEFRTGGKGLFNWVIAAQQHYSFFEHLEQNREYMHFLLHGSGLPDDGLWDQTGERLSINLVAIRGELVLDHLEAMVKDGDDERYLTTVLPDEINKRILVQTRAIAAHYSFNRQNGLDSTDILARYRAFALENICPGTLLDPDQ